MHLHFTKQDGAISSAIRGFDSSLGSHVGCESPWMPGIVIDTSFKHKGVRAFYRDEWLKHNLLVESVSVPLKDEKVAAEWLVSHIGKPYDHSAILGIALLRNWESEDKFYCSELAILACLRGGCAIRTRPAEIGLRLAHELAFSWSQK